MVAPVKRARGARGASPLSRQTARRLLGRLLVQAEAGDVAAAEALVRLAMTAGKVPTADSRREQAVA